MLGKKVACRKWSRVGFRKVTHFVHVDAVGVGPGVLEVFLQPLPQGIGDLMKADKLLDLSHLGVVAGGAGVEALDDGWDVTENTGVHQRADHHHTSRKNLEAQSESDLIFLFMKKVLTTIHGKKENTEFWTSTNGNLSLATRKRATNNQSINRSIIIQSINRLKNDWKLQIENFWLWIR